MKITTDNNYGADRDGNRGHSVTSYELEHTQDEKDEIAEVLFDNGTTSECSGTYEINYNGICIEVDAEEYSVEIKKLEDKDDV